jgi:hypothetical protein
MYQSQSAKLARGSALEPLLTIGNRISACVIAFKILSEFDPLAAAKLITIRARG